MAALRVRVRRFTAVAMRRLLLRLHQSLLLSAAVTHVGLEVLVHVERRQLNVHSIVLRGDERLPHAVVVGVSVNLLHGGKKQKQSSGAAAERSERLQLRIRPRPLSSLLSFLLHVRATWLKGAESNAESHTENEEERGDSNREASEARRKPQRKKAASVSDRSFTHCRLQNSQNSTNNSIKQSVLYFQTG